MPRLKDGDDRHVSKPPSDWQKHVLIEALPLSRAQRTELQKRVIRVTEAWRKRTGWRPSKQPVRKVSSWLLTRKRRRDIVAYAMWANRTMAGYGYSQSRPKAFIRSNPSKWTKYRYADCSSFVIRAYQVCGAPSPSAYGFSGYGSTWDEEPHGTPVSIAAGHLIPSDLVFYSGHVALYVGNGMAVGWGSSRGPLLLPLRYRSDLHAYGRRYFG